MKSVNNSVSRVFSKRALAIAGTAALLGGCSVIPKTGPSETAGPVTAPTPEPSATALPTDATRHRVALLVPMGGNTAEVGRSIANATTMALLDTNANNLRLTTYDTSKGAASAARKAIADGNKLILGPLLAENVPAVQAAARPANVPAISFSNDIRVASADVFLMGHVPEQSIRRSVAYARERGSNNFAALVPEGTYGQRSFDALNNALNDFGGNLVGSASYARGNTSIVSAAQRLRAAGGYDTVVIADGARLAVLAAAEVKSSGADGTRILGTELWSGESVLTRSNAIDGALFSAVSDGRFKRFADSYEGRFGSKPYRIATLGYDSVLLTLRVARDWRVGRDFPTAMLFDRGGFLGVDGPFRFGRDGIAERALEVREVRGNSVVPVDAAPSSFPR
ncbi:penicillin-binding protein activator [Erythrobacter insulae]|uniref:Penicillin-binding protein activator n=1 Tax=Erythrobacter insulae TaxID=2584124 RepID=A0A547P6X0_9SPHN|nr:penicillin-binding protein activator [Erythrobacter insulae]TRD09875.1 penicillin-binding protein activator [Erythrobacter insulae]